jgi:DNA polymerase-1
MKPQRLLIIDVSNFIFRAFYAIRPLTSPKGVPVNAVYGVYTMFLKMISSHAPTHILCARDRKEPSFREKIYPEYKANRTEPPELLRPQFSLVDQLLETLRLPSYSLVGAEADDIIGTAVKKFEANFDEILIASGDKDLMQFVSEKVHILDTMKDKIFQREDVKEKMGVYPEQIVDYLSLIGDNSDNIPGVPGIGPKGAQTLIEEYKNLETILSQASTLKNSRLQKTLMENQALAELSKKLVTIDCDVPLNFTKEALIWELQTTQELIQFLKELGFKSALEKLPPLKEKIPSQEIALAEYSPVEQTTEKNVTTLSSHDAWMNWLEYHRKNQPQSNLVVCMSGYFSNSDDPFSSLEAVACRILQVNQMYDHVFYKILDEKKFLESLIASEIDWVLWEAKPFLARAFYHQVNLTSLKDLSQLLFLIYPDERIDLESLAQKYSINLAPEDSLTQQHDLFSLPEASTSSRSLTLKLDQETLIVAKAWSEGWPKLKAEGLLDVYLNLDMPLLNILAQMESVGVLLHPETFKNLEHEYALELNQIEQDATKAVGKHFNLKSPKQVAQILFEELKLPVIKKTKTGYSTDVDVLEELSKLSLSPLPELLLKYREIEKLQSTYVKVLPQLIHPKDGRLHTHYRPANAATGRLSSDNPNLQNIPARTERGRRLRKGFIAKPGFSFVSADYSQVELRILGHFSQDPVMLESFRKNLDIHTQTASEIFHLPLSQVTKDQRNYAKAINFGLMYGQTSFGLSQTLKIPQKQAKEYIEHYFAKFQRVKGYLDGLKEFAEKHGYAVTLFGRKRPLRDIQSQNRQVKAMAERMAINSPIQGTAADIIKKSMIELSNLLREKNWQAQIILQVHDELIVECPDERVEEVKNAMKTVMENSTILSVPLSVETAHGKDWYSLK